MKDTRRPVASGIVFRAGPQRAYTSATCAHAASRHGARRHATRSRSAASGGVFNSPSAHATRGGSGALRRAWQRATAGARVFERPHLHVPVGRVAFGGIIREVNLHQRASHRPLAGGRVVDVEARGADAQALRRRRTRRVVQRAKRSRVGVAHGNTRAARLAALRSVRRAGK